MHITLISLIKRKGMASLFFILVMIGVVFTAYVPLRLAKHEADNTKEQITINDEALRLEKDKELLNIYPIPSLDVDTINFTLINKCELSIEINRCWINDTEIIVDESVPAMSTVEIGPFDLVPIDGGRFKISVTSSRGNVFDSHVGILYYSGGEWTNELIGFRLIFPSKNVCSQMSPMDISIKDEDGFVYQDEVVYWCISASEVFFELGEAGVYRLIIEAHSDTIFNDTRTINWPLGDPVIEFEFQISGDELVI